MDFVQRVVEAGRPVNAEQLQLMLDGCNIHVSLHEAERLYWKYSMAWIGDTDRRLDAQAEVHRYQ